MLQIMKNGVGTALGEVMAGLMVSVPIVDDRAAAFFRKYGRRPLLRSISQRTLTALRRRAAREKLVRVTSLPHGGHLKVDLRDISGTLYFNPAAIEPITVKYVSDRLERDSVFIDVGANIGYYAVTVGSLLRKLGGGRVYAFEPNPAPYGLLSESIQQSDLADLVKAFPAAIGRADQDAIALYLAADGNSALSATKPWPGHLESGVLSVNHHINVYCRSLDSFVAEQRITRIDWLKIDVETAEREVLEGMASILDVMPPAHIICETSLDGEVSSLLRSKAYDSLLLERIDPTLDNWGNVLFVRDTVSR